MYQTIFIGMALDLWGSSTYAEMARLDRFY